MLERAWSAPFTTRSDFARLYPEQIAIAACRGLITTQSTRIKWGRTWRLTSEGLRLLENMKNDAD